MRYRLSWQGCRCAEAVGIPVGWPKKKLNMVMQQVCTGKFLLQRSFSKSALLGLVIIFSALYLQLKPRHRFKDLPDIERTWSTALEITERPYLFLLSPARYSGTPQNFWWLRILQQQMAVERGTRFLLTGSSLEPCSLWALDINRSKRNILLQQKDRERAELDITILTVFNW